MSCWLSAGFIGVREQLFPGRCGFLLGGGGAGIIYYFKFKTPPPHFLLIINNTAGEYMIIRSYMEIADATGKEKKKKGGGEVAARNSGALARKFSGFGPNIGT